MPVCYVSPVLTTAAHRKLLDGLADKGFGKDSLADMQKVIKAQSSDLFDVGSSQKTEYKAR